SRQHRLDLVRGKDLRAGRTHPRLLDQLLRIRHARPQRGPAIVLYYVTHRSRSPNRNSSTRSRLMWAMPSTGDASMGGGSNTGTLRNGEPHVRGGLIGTLPTKNFDLLFAPTGRPTTTCTRWPSIS